MRVMIVVTHLLGTGHLRRAALLERAFAEAGHDVALVSGGLPVQGLHPGVDLVQLPPVASDGVDFARLLRADGSPADAGYMAARLDALLRAQADFAPDVLITELFPFGRRVLAGEFTALLSQTRARLVLSSVRDILAPPSRPAKAEAAMALIEAHYDGVLVHSDAAVVPLGASWPVTPALAACLHYTGFVAPPPPRAAPQGDGAGEVLVSAGGGPVGAALFAAALEAAGLTPGLRWRLLVGGADPETRIAALAARAPDGVVIEGARPDFRQMLTRAAVSVSMCGYNTAMDLLQTGIPALVVPFDEGAEVEQGLRAESLSHLPGVTMMRAAALDARSMAEAVRALAALPRRTGEGLAMDGAARSVAITERLLRGRS